MCSMVERVGFDLLGVFCNFSFSFSFAYLYEWPFIFKFFGDKNSFCERRRHNTTACREIPLVSYAVIVKETDRKSLWPTFRNIRYGNGNFISKKYHSDMFTMIVGFPNSVRTEITELNKFGLILERFFEVLYCTSTCTSIQSKTKMKRSNGPTNPITRNMKALQPMLTCTSTTKAFTN